MKKEDIDKSNILAVISFLKEKEKLKDKKTRWRKITDMDLLGKITSKKVVNPTKNIDKVLAFRMQEEFGPKKRIKPWRTGTKSQQQIAPKGHKKGFRGKSIS